MPRRDDELLDIPTIVPDDDTRPRQQVAREARPQTTHSEHLSTVNIALPILFLALAGGSAYFHYELTKLRVENQQWSARVNNLESQLGLTHSEQQASRQSLDQQVNKLDKAAQTSAEEIKKLQRLVNDQQAKAISALETQTKTLDKNSAQHQQQLATLDQRLSKLDDVQRNQLQPLQKQTEALQAAITRLQAAVGDIQGQQHRNSSQAAEAAMSSAQVLESVEPLQKKLSELNRQLAAQQESLNSLESFRRSANSDLNRLKQGGGAY